MSKVVFKANLPSSLMGVDLPVEVRNFKGALISRQLFGTPVSLEKGKYVAALQMPAGQEIHLPFEVRREGTTEVIISDRSVARGQQVEDSEKTNEYLRGTGPQSVLLRRRPFRDPDSLILPDVFWSSGVEKFHGPSLLSVTGFEGNALGSELTQITGPDWLRVVANPSNPHVVEVECLNRRVVLIQIRREGRRPLHLVLPSSRSEDEALARIVFRDTGARDYVIEAHPGDPRADSVLQYFRYGRMAQAFTLGSAYAEKLLRGKVRFPVTAAVGAYSLLRSGDLDRLHDWTSNLYNWSPWLPDGAAILGEHLARQAKHTEALTTFLSLSERGLPIFTDGLSYAVERLRRYCRNKDHFDDESIGRASKVLDRLTDFALGVDFTQALVTFTVQEEEKEEVPVPRRMKRKLPTPAAKMAEVEESVPA